MKKVLIMLGVVFLLIAFVKGTFFVAEAGEFTIVAQFGKPVSVIDKPGLYVKWINPIQNVIRVNKRLQIFDPAPGEYLSADKKNLVIDSVAFWRVQDPKKYLRTVRDKNGLEMALHDILTSTIGAIFGQYELHDLISTEQNKGQLPEIAKKITADMKADVENRFGIKLLSADIKRLSFPTQNRNSVFNRMRAERQRIATKYLAEGEEQAVKIRSGANKEKREILADANKQASEIISTAEAKALELYSKSFSKDPEFYKFQRTLQTYKTMLEKNTTIVFSDDSPLLKYINSK